MQRLGLAGHKSASYSLLAQPVSNTLHFVLESAAPKTASFTALLRNPAAIHVPRHAAHVVAGGGAEEHGQFAQFFGGGELHGRFFFAQRLSGGGHERLRYPDAATRHAPGVGWLGWENILLTMSCYKYESYSRLFGGG